jgi:hypothetical protein
MDMGAAKKLQAILAKKAITDPKTIDHLINSANQRGEKINNFTKKIITLIFQN